MTDETKPVFSVEFERIIAEFELSGHPGGTDEEQGLAVLNLLRGLARLRMKHFPNEKIPVHDDPSLRNGLATGWIPNLSTPLLRLFSIVLAETLRQR